MAKAPFRLDKYDLSLLTAFMIVEHDDGNELVIADLVRQAIEAYLDKAEQGVVLLRQIRSEQDVTGDYQSVTFDIDDDSWARCRLIADEYHCNVAQIFRNAIADYVLEHQATYLGRRRAQVATMRDQ